jgi:pyruvate dehydrogenase E2 component (dihydrolipoamide acetyltransferase)
MLRSFGHIRQSIVSRRSSSYAGVIRVLRYPQLSPTMQFGRIVKWNGKVGDLIPTNGLIMEVEAFSLTKTESSDTTSLLEIELQEEMYIAKLLRQEGSSLINIGTPVAIFCEEKDDLRHFLNFDDKMIGDIQLSAMWQAYVKNKTDSGSCGCS